MPDIGKFYERVKHEYIYPKHFPYGVSLSDDSFRAAVRAAYDDIIMLIPGLNGRGNQDEDWYMAEWLKRNRADYSSVSYRDQSELANYIYQIR
jgi:hypothetical protein